jgi:PST family polysaccharide transporter
LSVPDNSRELNIDHLVGDIERRSVHGGAIMFAAQAIKMVTQFAAAIVLTRLLPPAAFGLIAMAMALNTFLDPLKELGLTAATMQKTDITQEQVTALFWINALGGALLTLALFLAAPVVAGFYGQPELVPVIQWLSVSFALSGLAGQHWALLRRQMRYATVATIDTGAELIGFACAVALAVGGGGYWALVVQRLIVPFLVLIGSWSTCRWRPGRPKLVPGLRDLFGFGASVTGCNIAVAITRSIDQILIGWLWGPSVLGLYERTTRLLQVPITNIYAPLYAVALPALSRIAHQPQRYRRAFTEILEKLAMVTMPAAALVVVTADWVVEFLFGPVWSEAAPLIAFFALAAIYQPSLIASSLLYLTQDRPREMFRAVMIDSAISAASIVIALPFGAIAVAGSFAVTGLLLRVPVGFWLAARRGPVLLRDIYVSLLPSALTAVSVGGFVWLLRPLLERMDLSVLASLALSAAAGIVVAALTFCAIPQSRRTMRNIGQFAQFLRGREPKVQT